MASDWGSGHAFGKANLPFKSEPGTLGPGNGASLLLSRPPISASNLTEPNRDQPGNCGGTWAGATLNQPTSRGSVSPTSEGGR
jgi:hypothetical protein